jgi:hypothetical protein
MADTALASMSAATALTGAELIYGTQSSADAKITAEQLRIWTAALPQNSNSANYTTVLADAGKHIFHPSADTSARDFTIDGSVAYPVGTVITFINQHSGGVITVKITTDAMRLAGAGTTGDRTLAADGIATAIKVASGQWMISGTGLT